MDGESDGEDFDAMRSDDDRTENLAMTWLKLDSNDPALKELCHGQVHDREVTKYLPLLVRGAVGGQPKSDSRSMLFAGRI
jgi:hypothetical protein